MDRLLFLRRHLDRSMLGAEIGPFFSPVVPKSDGWKTIVVDTADATELRRRALSHGSELVNNAANRIEEVDAVWSGQPLDELCLPIFGAQLDFVVASHVIEHVPDLVGFLQQCSRMLKRDGVISLAVPDMRKCFDLLKTPTATREVLTAFREKRIRHTPETLFEARGYATVRGDTAAWLSGSLDPIAFNGNFLHTQAAYLQDFEAASEDVPYVDAHAWHFTPASFELVMLELNVMGFTDFAIDWLEQSLGSEFIVQLRRKQLTPSYAELQESRMRLALRRYVEFAAELPELSWPGTKRSRPAPPVAGIDPWPVKRRVSSLRQRLAYTFRRRLAR